MFYYNSVSYIHNMPRLYSNGVMGNGSHCMHILTHSLHPPAVNSTWSYRCALKQALSTFMGCPKHLCTITSCVCTHTVLYCTSVPCTTIIWFTITVYLICVICLIYIALVSWLMFTLYTYFQAFFTNLAWNYICSNASEANSNEALLNNSMPLTL